MSVTRVILYDWFKDTLFLVENGVMTSLKPPCLKHFKTYFFPSFASVNYDMFGTGTGILACLLRGEKVGAFNALSPSKWRV